MNKVVCIIDKLQIDEQQVLTLFNQKVCISGSCAKAVDKTYYVNKCRFSKFINLCMNMVVDMISLSI